MSLSDFGDKAYLLLENGRVFEGRSFGAQGTTIGETVFCTSSVGYQQMLTDPSYTGQLLVQTFPLGGCYGVNDEDFEGAAPSLAGYIVREWSETPSNFRMNDSLDSFMKKQGIIGICGIDTRSLTRAIRDLGIMRGMITTQDVNAQKDALLAQLKGTKCATDSISSCSARVEKEVFLSSNPCCNTVLYDFGAKNSTIANLCAHGCNVTAVSSGTALSEVLAMKPDGIILSEGSGDPTLHMDIVEGLAGLLTAGIPTLGIGIGHQFMALAAGAKTTKMSSGHHGSNQPVKDLNSGKIYVTAQNHSFVVDGESIKNLIADISHINVNDGSCEGLSYKTAPIITVQFQPDSSGSVLDTSYILESFVQLAKKHSGEGK